MSESEAEGARIPHVTHILLIDDDPIFRLGLRTALEPFVDIQVVAEADTGAAVLEVLSTLSHANAVDLVVLELGRDRSNPNEELNVSSLEVEGSEDNLQPSNLQPSTFQPSTFQPSTFQPSTPSLSGLALCQQLKAIYPNLPVLL